MKDERKHLMFTIILVYYLGMMIPSDVQGPGLLAELPAAAQRRHQEDLPLYQLPRTRVVSKTSAYMGMLSSRCSADA